MTQRTVYLARHLNENPEVIPDGSGTGDIIGTNPLDVEDGSAGYVEVIWESPTVGSIYMTQITFRLQHDGISPVRTGPVQAVFADFSYEVETTGLVLPGISIANTVPTLERPGVGDSTYPLTWARMEKQMVMPIDAGEWDTVDDTSHPWRIATSAGGTFGSVMTARMTYLRIIVEWAGAIPTRVYPRADGLGMGAPRLFDNRSPYRSARVFGQI